MFTNQSTQTENIKINNIPCLKLKPTNVHGELPTVIFYHGWHSCKELQQFKAFVLTSLGYQVIIPDALCHGERNPIDHDDPKMLDEYFWKIIFQTVSESKQLIQTLIHEHDADPERIAVMGSSMGGFSASGVFGENPMLKCLINFNGACAWVKAEELFRVMDQKAPMNEREIAIFSQYDLLTHKNMTNQRPILMLHGDSDSLIPIEIQRTFYREVAPLYADNPELLQLVEIKRLDHYITTGMFETAIEWLQKYL